MPTCRDVADHASDLLDDTLPWTTRLQLRMHLLMCGRCREYVRQLALVIATLRALPPEEPSDVEREALIAAFRSKL
ncbi:MAG: zf-HC2 domain-containing protein [Acidobacteria bacterium]|nr:zf-HC2 domain-containing protein [Acidobacteriota bacterium]